MIFFREIKQVANRRRLLEIRKTTTVEKVGLIKKDHAHLILEANFVKSTEI